MPEEELQAALADVFNTEPFDHWQEHLNRGTTVIVRLASLLETRDQACQLESKGPIDIDQATFRVVRHDRHPMGRWCDLVAPNAVRPARAVITIPGPMPKYGAQTKEILARTETDFSRLDQAVERLCTKMLLLMPDCLSKTVNSLRKHKQWHWDNTNVTNREWLALNMMTEAKAGFRAFNEGPKGRREVDFVRLRQLLAQGHPWDDELIREISPQYQPES